MGAGGSTQGGGGTSSSRGNAAGAGGTTDKRAPSTLTQMKRSATAPMATQFPVMPFNPSTHASLGAKGVGVVLSREELLAASGDAAAAPPPGEQSIANANLNGSSAPGGGGGGGGGGLHQGEQYRWFAEDLERMGRWEPYNAESSQRLEEAFLSRRMSCLVTLRKRAYTVDLTTMQQLPEGLTAVPPSSSLAKASGTNSSGAQQPLAPTQRTRRVRRAAAKVTQSTPNGEEKVEMVHEALVDPFADDADSESSNAAAVDGAVVQQQQQQQQQSCSQAAAVSKGLPHLAFVCYPSMLPTYSLDVSPISSQLSAEAREAGIGNGTVAVISGGKDGRLVEWDSADGKVRTRYAISASRPTSVLVARYSPSARFVVCGCDDNDARLYKVGEPNPVYLLKGHTHKVYGISVMADERRVTTASMDTHVRVWDIETGACTHVEQAHTSHIFSILASRTNTNFCVSAGNDAIVCAHDFRLPSSVVMRLKGHTSTLWDVAIFPGDGGENVQLASSGMDSTVRLWDPRNPAEAVHVLRHHTKPVHSITYLPNNGRAILSSSKDSYVCLSETATGEMVWRAKAQQASVFRVLYHTEQQMMYTSGVSGLVNQWTWPQGCEW